jgi:hypothetical protein
MEQNGQVRHDVRAGMTRRISRRAIPIFVALVWAGLLAVAVARAHVCRQAMNPDGMSYLDMGMAFFDGDRSALTNGLWSPLYPFLLGLVEHTVSPTLAHRFAMVQWVNVAAFVFAILAFHAFLRAFLATLELTSTVSQILWIALAYALFAWSSFQLITTQIVSPDMLVAGFVYLATGMVLRIRQGFDSPRVFFLLGASLGVGYLAKAPLLPLGIVFIALATLASARRWRAWPRAALAGLAFLLVAAPHVILLSRSKSRLTFGESGGLNYAWHVNAIPGYVYWQGRGTGAGIPVHPTRQIAEEPPAFEFASPVPGTYPVWYDPSYWCEGAVPHFDVRQQLRALAKAGPPLRFVLWFAHEAVGISILVLWAVALIRARDKCLPGLLRQWPLLAPAGLALAMYALVHVEVRYIAPFVVLIWLGVMAGVWGNRARVPKVLFQVALVVSTVAVAGKALPQFSGESVQWCCTRSNVDIALALHARGLGPGEPIAVVGKGFSAYWAQLAGLKIVANVPDAGAFDAASPEQRQKVLVALARTPARAVAAVGAPRDASTRPWKRLAKTDLYLLELDETPGSAARGSEPSTSASHRIR